MFEALTGLKGSPNLRVILFLSPVAAGVLQLVPFRARDWFFFAFLATIFLPLALLTLAVRARERRRVALLTPYTRAMVNRTGRVATVTILGSASLLGGAAVAAWKLTVGS